MFGRKGTETRSTTREGDVKGVRGEGMYRRVAHMLGIPQSVINNAIQYQRLDRQDKRNFFVNS